MARTKGTGRARKNLDPTGNISPGVHEPAAAAYEPAPKAAERGNFAAALPEFRERAGFSSHAALAASAGVTSQNVRDWESGKAGLSPAQARQLAAALRCDWRDLFGDPDWIGPSRTPGHANHYNAPVPFEVPPGHRVWQHFGDALTGRGIRSGDLVLVDSSVLPQEGEVALATIQELGSTEQRTFFAVRSGRYLVEQRLDAPTAEPIPTEGPGIAIRGVGKRLFRNDL